MCGITGYIGGRPAVETALTNLKRLEYRGYDSAGIAYLNDGRINIVRAVGKIASLERALKGEPNEAQVAIAHTRWATHGRPSKANAHPHADCTGQLAVVHNGIIENYAELRRELIAKGHTFASETDTEVLAHLIEEELSLSLHSDFAASMRTALKRVVGSYAAAIIWKEAPETIYAARKDSPLVIGLGDGENFLASDITAVMRYTRRVVLLEDGDFAIITKNSVAISDLSGEPVSREPMDVTWDDTAAEKGGYPHFMLKEIYEGPRTVRDTMRGRLGSDGIVHFPELKLTPADWAKFRRIAIVGCGTAYHAGVVGKRLFP